MTRKVSKNNVLVTVPLLGSPVLRLSDNIAFKMLIGSDRHTARGIWYKVIASDGNGLLVESYEYIDN